MKEYECGPGTFTFARKGEPRWTRNPYDEPCEFVFSYYSATNEEKSGYIEINKDTE